MGCLGVHFALTNEQRDKLLSFDSDEARIDYVREDIEEAWEDEFVQETDKAWDAIHRCLTEHRPNVERLDPDAGTYPLNMCILGGKKLFEDENSYIIR